MQDITVQELQERIENGQMPVMVDVREPYEWELQHLDGIHKISMGDIPAKMEEMATNWKEEELVVICRSGGRSGRITQYLRSQGFQHVRNLTGGMLAWKEEIDPSFIIE